MYNIYQLLKKLPLNKARASSKLTVPSFSERIASFVRGSRFFSFVKGCGTIVFSESGTETCSIEFCQRFINTNCYKLQNRIKYIYTCTIICAKYIYNNNNNNNNNNKNNKQTLKQIKKIGIQTI